MAHWLNFSLESTLNKDVREILRLIDGLNYRSKTEMRNDDLHLLSGLIQKAYPDGEYFKDMRHRL